MVIIRVALTGGRPTFGRDTRVVGGRHKDVVPSSAPPGGKRVGGTPVRPKRVKGARPRDG